MSCRDKGGIMRGRSCSRHSPSTPKLYEAMLLVKESARQELETDARLLPDAAHRNQAETWNFCVPLRRTDRRDAGDLRRGGPPRRAFKTKRKKALHQGKKTLGRRRRSSIPDPLLLSSVPVQSIRYANSAGGNEHGRTIAEDGARENKSAQEAEKGVGSSDVELRIS
ncbi:hypothetical protein K0M31_016676 [Melipona bicolor]|uniref:Uncharacterized protein n=1 Tax=Melipona bicolor TaxID=60889 RepID=A0AA40KEJ8_9HYME|nr:hypothetical protein K0M31_016676 [Melipona bicolor]